MLNDDILNEVLLSVILQSVMAPSPVILPVSSKNFVFLISILFSFFLSLSFYDLLSQQKASYLSQPLCLIE
jgi:hypothetical protein